MTTIEVRPRFTVTRDRAAAAGPFRTGSRPRRIRLPQGWPLAVIIAGYPIWWVVGITPVLFPVAAVLLLRQLVRGGRLKVPPGFSIYLLFLAVVVISAAALNVTAPGTVPPSGASRYASFVLRLLDYASVAVFMLYVGNRSEAQLPRSAVIRWMSLLAVWTVLLGLLAIPFPSFSFPTVLSLVLPQSVLDLVGPGLSTNALAQVQPVLGFDAPRPAAPFAYTNAWGNSLSLLLVWLCVDATASRSKLVKLGTAALLLVSVAPIVYSLNRGVWIGLGLSIIYVAVRFAARGRLAAISVLALAVGAVSVAFIASPLQSIVTERLAHGHSNGTRSSLAISSLNAAASSPVLGYGSTRQAIGSDASITVGKTAACPRCGNQNVGSTGQFLLLLIAQGVTGTVLYLVYFLYTAWVYRRDASAIGIAGTLVILLNVFYGLFYTALQIPLALTFISIGLLWRNHALREAGHVPRASPAASR